MQTSAPGLLQCLPMPPQILPNPHELHWLSPVPPLAAPAPPAAPGSLAVPLLQSNDRAFKEELGKLVDLTIWAQAKERSKEELGRRWAGRGQEQPFWAVGGGVGL